MTTLNSSLIKRSIQVLTVIDSNSHNNPASCKTYMYRLSNLKFRNPLVLGLLIVFEMTAYLFLALD